MVFMNAVEHDKIYAQVSHFGLRFNKKQCFGNFFHKLIFILNPRRHLFGHFFNNSSYQKY